MLSITRSSRSGFTLIEIMVVIGIIAILAVTGMAAIAAVQKSNRETKRQTDMVATMTLSESYKDQTGEYPITTITAWTGAGSFSTLVPKAAKEQNATSYEYTYGGAVGQFCACASLETIGKGNSIVAAPADGKCVFTSPMPATAPWFFCVQGGI